MNAVALSDSTRSKSPLSKRVLSTHGLCLNSGKGRVDGVFHVWIEKV
jgi:hypothetical protein